MAANFIAQADIKDRVAIVESWQPFTCLNLLAHAPDARSREILLWACVGRFRVPLPKESAEKGQFPSAPAEDNHDEFEPPKEYQP